MIELSNTGKPYLVVNHRPFADQSKPITEGFDDKDRAIRYAQRLNSERVDVIDCRANEYVVRYPTSQFGQTQCQP